jgi:putative hydrolase of the HAD superfamily
MLWGNRHRRHPWSFPMSLKDFKVLTFDVVGTLIDFEGGMLAYLRSAAPDARVTDDDFLAAYRRARADGTSGWYPDDLERCWHAIAPALGLPDNDAIARGLRDSVAQWPAFPDSVDALKRLGKHFKLVTMTNAQHWALAHFDKTLGSPFDMLLSCDDALCEKPDARYFAYARGRIEGAWGYKQADNLHVAQSQYHDIGVSKRLGIATCWIERRHGQKGSGGTLESEHTVPDYHFHTLAALADAVEAGL